MRRTMPLVVAGSLVAVVGVCGCSAGPDVHGHMGGALAVGFPESGGISLNPPEDRRPGQQWSGSFGSFLPCVARGEGPIEITGVSWSGEPAPVSAVASVRTFDSSTDTPIGSMIGTAEHPRLDGIRSLSVREGVKGFEVDKPYSAELGFDGAVTDEIVISLTAGDEGGHVGDVTFTYVTPDGAEHAVRADWDFYLCGSQVPADLLCP